MRANGGQVEVLLRVKQANNPAFCFLSPSHPMHAYYRWVIETNPQVRRKGKTSRGRRVAFPSLQAECTCAVIFWAAVPREALMLRGKAMAKVTIGGEHASVCIDLSRCLPLCGRRSW